MTSQSKPHRAQRAGAIAMSASLLLQTVLPAHAVVSQNPGLYSNPPDANVMFTLDDSGSMLSDAIPDFVDDVTGMPTNDNSAAIAGFGARFPGMWRNSASLYLTPTYYQSTNAVARYMRSAAGNPLYYNPAVRYTPWPLAGNDTTTNANASVAAVNVHAFDPFTTGRAINLQVRLPATSTGSDNESNNFWPATYYVYNNPTPLPPATPSSALNIAANFSKVEIKPFQTPLRPTVASVYARGADRTDCASPVVPALCTYAEELQNFANWLQYYRSRMLMAKGGVAQAFAKQGSNLRVGFGTINSTGTVRQGVQTFSGARRTSFYNDLYPRPNNGGTPLRKAMDDVGKYFTRSDVGNPWAENPSSTSIGTEFSCRKSIHILSTDGYWNGAAASTSAATNDNDADSRSGTLADVAAYYWNTDLRTLDNLVPASKRDPATWQHLTTYTVGLGISGTGTVRRTSDNSTVIPPANLLSPNPVLDRNAGKSWLEVAEVRDHLVENKVAMTWTTPVADAATTGDDLIHASMNGRGRYYSASDPTKLKNGLASALAEAADIPRSLANIVTQTPQLTEGSAVYQATYNPSQWSGRFYAFPQAKNGTVSTTPGSEIWEASNKMPEPASRHIFSWNPTLRAGNNFSWPELTPTQQLGLNNDSRVLDFLRGSDANESARGGTFRDRARYAKGGVPGGVLGDIVNGSPIKGPSAGGGYQKLPTGSPGQGTYTSFRSPTNLDLDAMRNTLFLGANDGMLHAFELASGVERFAFVPNAAFNVPRGVNGLGERKLAMLSDPGYTHRFTVDGPPQIADAFIGSGNVLESWKSVLVSAHGAGARSVFAMDITNPAVSATGFGTNKLMWEFSEADNADMGYLGNYPHVARMRNGSWVALFGNGYDSANGQAKLFVLDLATGAVLWQQAVGAAGGNGLSQPNFVVNKNREVTAIYAGDLKGNLWKFDVDSADPGQWKVAFGAAPNYTPLFANADTQPITVMPELTEHPNGGAMVTFGTGKLFDVSDSSGSAATPANVNLNTQALYGIWDKPAESTGFSGTSKLVAQAMNTSLAAATSAATNVAGTTSRTVDWATKRGWYLDLTSGGERVNVNPQQINSVLLIVANRPDSDPCKSGGNSRLFALDPITGSAPDFAVFDSNGVGGVTTADKGYNVKSFAFGVMSLPTFQSKKRGTDAIRPELVNTRGQTGARLGGVELKTGTPTDCEQWLLAGASDTSISGADFNTCKTGNPRISWRQLK